jgi:parallel beta-helix repeat protein
MTYQTPKKIYYILISTIIFSLLLLSQKGTTQNLTYQRQNHTITILYVGGEGPNNYTSIQDAINNASTGYTIYVYDDSSPYYETLIINKSIILMGENTETTIIDGSGSGHVISLIENNITVTGFTIKYCGGTWTRAGIFVISSDNTITKNQIIDCRNGIFIEYKSYNTISNNTIIHNGYHGIRIEYSSHNQIINNTLIDNEGNAIYLWETTNNIISGNTLAESYYSGILVGDHSNNNLIFHNNFKQNRLENANDAWTNIWHYENTGNYWDDYLGVDEDGDGIGDAPYEIKGGAIDSYPLIYPYGEITLELVKPEPHFLYIHNREICQFFMTVIIGSIDIKVIAYEYQNGIDYVDFFIDDIHQITIDEPPYQWTWDDDMFFRHTLTTTAYDTSGKNISHQLQIWKFF